MTDKNTEMARRVAAAVLGAGGKTYYVGGFVRDRVLGLENKDIDIEVHGVSVRTLEKVLDSLGQRRTMGVSFGVWGLSGYDLDIAMPRSEKATGRGHKDFEVFVDPFLGEEKAARRRDFTMNAMMQDVLTGEVLDFYGGRDDIARKTVRHVNDGTFAEDPLRVFRAAQFAARFGYTVAPQTLALAASMDTAALAAERVMAETEKALLKAERPSVFFETLRRMDRLSVWFPELRALIGASADGASSCAGDRWGRALRTLDEAAALRAQASEPLPFLLAALCCVLCGGAENERTEAPGGAETPAARFLGRLTNEVRLKNYVLNMAPLCEKTDVYENADTPVLAYMEWFDRSVCPVDLPLLAKAVFLGRDAEKDRAARLRSFSPTERVLAEMLALYEERMRAPCVMGRDLIGAGISPGPRFGEALKYAHTLRLRGVPREEQLRRTLERLGGNG